MKALEKGAYIQHFQYGLGVITQADSEYTDIDFDTHGLKKFRTAIVVLERAEGTPPPRKRRARKMPVAAAGAAVAAVAVVAVKPAGKK
jgi:hypothetical protein